MSWFRIYVDKKITEQGGGDHSRVFDCEAADATAAADKLTLEDDEMFNSVVPLSFGDPN